MSQDNKISQGDNNKEPTGQEQPVESNLTENEAQLIVNMRIYDVLLAIYTELTEGSTKADDLMELHAAGKLLGPLPALDARSLDEDTNE